MTVQIEQVGRRLIVDGRMLQFNASASQPPIIGKRYYTSHTQMHNVAFGGES